MWLGRYNGLYMLRDCDRSPGEKRNRPYTDSYNTPFLRVRLFQTKKLPFHMKKYAVIRII